MSRVFKDEIDPESMARTWVALENRGRNPEVILKRPRPPEPMLEKARKEIEALDKAKTEDLPAMTKVVGVTDLEFKVLMNGQYCGRVELDARTHTWMSIDRDLKLRAWSTRQHAVEHLAINQKAYNTALRRRKLLS